MAALVDAVIDRWFTPEFADTHPEDIERVPVAAARHRPGGLRRVLRGHPRMPTSDEDVHAIVDPNPARRRHP